MLLAGAPLARAAGASAQARHCERRDRQQDGPNAPGWAAREEWAATSVRREGGEATLRALASTSSACGAMNRVPEVSLRWRRVLLVAAHSSPRGAAWGNVKLATNSLMAFRDARDNRGNFLRDHTLLARSA